MRNDRLKSLRAGLGNTQEQFAEKLGATQRMVSYWERGVSEPSNDMLVSIANICDVSVDYLLGRTNTPNLNAHPIGQIDGVGARYVTSTKAPPSPEQAAELIMEAKSDRTVTLDPKAVPSTREELKQFVLDLIASAGKQEE
ncbi:hypothetical protein AGMMS49992_27080 [Clostridia bacterium]|nr:hypothetical protein AGMMS49992_27080 [Clostridia bacterium]